MYNNVKKRENMFSMISACDTFKTSNTYVYEFQYTFSQKQIPEKWALNLASSIYIQKIYNYKSKHSPLNFPGRLQKLSLIKVKLQKNLKIDEMRRRKEQTTAGKKS
jgi:hypothetical protein